MKNRQNIKNMVTNRNSKQSVGLILNNIRNSVYKGSNDYLLKYENENFDQAIPDDIKILFKYLITLQNKKIKEEYYKCQNQETNINVLVFFLDFVILVLLTYDYFTFYDNDYEFKLMNYIVRGL